jgi:hypothetical protein
MMHVVCYFYNKCSCTELQVLTHDFFLLGDEIRQIIDDSSSEVNLSSSDFWVLVAALKVASLS